MIVFSFKQNLSYILKTYKNIKELISQDIDRLKQVEEDQNIELSRSISIEKKLKKDYLENFKISTYLMLFSCFEEFLYHVCKNEKIKSGNSAGFNRFKQQLKQLNYVVSDCDWELLNSFSEIRNVMLHANGRSDIVSDNNKLDKAINNINKSLNQKIVYRHELWSAATKEIHKQSNSPEKLIITEDFNSFFCGITCNYFLKYQEDLIACFLLKSDVGDEHDVYLYRSTENKKGSGRKNNIQFKYEYKTSDGALVDKIDEHTFYHTEKKIKLYK